MSNRLTELSVQFVKRNARKRGPTSSEAWNDNGEELSTDLASLSAQWNQSLLPLVSTLPNNSNDLDAFTNGLSGKTLLVDPLATLSINSRYYNASKSRPGSVLEHFDALYALVNNSIEDLQASITGAVPSASAISLVDIADNFSSSNVEDALAELANSIFTATSHSGLSGLLNDDHTQYLNRSGVRSMAGTLNMNLNLITNIGSTGTNFTAGGGLDMNGVIKMSDGSASAPGIRVSDDATTGIHYTAGQPLGFAVGGASKINCSSNSASIVNVASFDVISSLFKVQSNRGFNTSFISNNVSGGAVTFGITSNTMNMTAASGVTIATITGGIAGMILWLYFGDANITITDTAAATANTVNLSAAFTSAANTVLCLMHNGTKWFEVSRSVNG